MDGKGFGICSDRSMFAEAPSPQISVAEDHEIWTEAIWYLLRSFNASKAPNPHRSCRGWYMNVKLEHGDGTPSLLVSGKTLIRRVIAHPSYVSLPNPHRNSIAPTQPLSGTCSSSSC